MSSQTTLIRLGSRTDSRPILNSVWCRIPETLPKGGWCKPTKPLLFQVCYKEPPVQPLSTRHTNLRKSFSNNYHGKTYLSQGVSGLSPIPTHHTYTLNINNYHVIRFNVSQRIRLSPPSLSSNVFLSEKTSPTSNPGNCKFT